MCQGKRCRRALAVGTLVLVELHELALVALVRETPEILDEPLAVEDGEDEHPDHDRFSDFFHQLPPVEA